jgi:hypothetical protein
LTSLFSSLHFEETVSREKAASIFTPKPLILHGPNCPRISKHQPQQVSKRVRCQWPDWTKSQCEIQTFLLKLVRSSWFEI